MGGGRTKKKHIGGVYVTITTVARKRSTYNKWRNKRLRMVCGTKSSGNPCISQWMHIGSGRVILVVSFGIDVYMRVWVTRRVIFPVRVVLGIVTCRKMGNGRRRHQIGLSIHLIGWRQWMAECINPSAFPAVISGLNTREAWCCVVAVMTPHVRVHVKLSTTVWPGTPKCWKGISKI